MTSNAERAVEHLEKLARKLEKRRFSARVRIGKNHTLCLHVINPATPVLTEGLILAIDGDAELCVFFPWLQRIAPVGDLIAAADRVERVLAEIGR